MSHSTILIPSNSARESVGSSPSLFISSDTKAEPTTSLDLAIEPDLEAEPSNAQPSSDYVPSSPILVPVSPDYHPGPDTESAPIEDESEPNEDAPEVAEPLSAHIAPPPPVQITLTLPTSPTEPASTGPSRKRCSLNCLKVHLKTLLTETQEITHFKRKIQREE
ncbi:hypothetical protein Tco_0760050 [Tanacetum coccineum]